MSQKLSQNIESEEKESKTFFDANLQNTQKEFFPFLTGLDSDSSFLFAQNLREERNNERKNNNKNNTNDVLVELQEENDILDKDVPEIQSDETEFTKFRDIFKAVIPNIEDSELKKLFEKYGHDKVNGINIAIDEYSNWKTIESRKNNNSSDETREQSIVIDSDEDLDCQIIATTPKITDNNKQKKIKKRSFIESFGSSQRSLSSSPHSSIKQQRTLFNKGSFTLTQENKVHSLEDDNISIKSQKRPEIKWKRFIGSLQVNALATRPTIKAIPYGTTLKLVKSVPSKIKVKRAMSSFVRIIDTKTDREIGRVSEDIAQIVYPLLDSDIVCFEAIMIFCDNKRIQIGDVFILQLDVFLSSVTFEEQEEEPLYTQANNNNHWDSLKESDSEIKFNEYRRALLNLFDKLNIAPVIDEEKALADRERSFSQEIIDLDGNQSIYDLDSDSNLADKPNSQNDDENLNINQLQSFYRATQSMESLQNLPETEPDRDNFKLDLRKYQKQGLSWMLKRENELSKIKQDSEMAKPNDSAELMKNPLWKQFQWPKDLSWKTQQKKSTIQNSDDQIFFYANLHTGKFSLDKPTLKSLMRGGILADEMGLGKTISTLALILTVPFDSEYNKKPQKVLFEPTDIEDKSSINSYNSNSALPYASKTTLIIVPMSLLNQWASEFEKANASSNLTHEIYYGGNVSSLKKLLIKNKNPPSVVITTYGIVQNEWTKLKNDLSSFEDSTGLFSIKFFRIVIDEGHSIRNRNTVTCKAVTDLTSSRHWVLTGTPVINRLDDLYSLVRFLRLEPWGQVSFWNTFVTKPFESKKYKQALDVVNSVLEPVLLRRTKQMKDINGQKLVELPEKEVIVENLGFSSKQNIIYKHFLSLAETSVQSALNRGDLLKKYSVILVHILRLRQICCDPLLLGSLDEIDEDIKQSNKILENNDDINEEVNNLTTNYNENELSEVELEDVKNLIKERYFENDNILKTIECPICTNDNVEKADIIFTECGHSFCKKCLKEYIEFQTHKDLDFKCPNCRKTISPTRLLTLKTKITEEGENNQELIPFNGIHKSSKITALLHHLQVLYDTSPGEQVVVFSQFSTFLDILQDELSSHFDGSNIQIYKFDGRLSLKERSTTLTNFCEKEIGKMKILLLSLKAGGVGLNLTCASHAFMMDPWWSPSLEDQAIDRIHRIGQSNTVKVVRFIIKDSIEEKMLKIQERKRRIGEAMDADEDERRKRRIEEIKMLFE